MTKPNQLSILHLFALLGVTAIVLVPITAWGLYGVPVAFWLLALCVTVIKQRYRLAAGVLALGVLLMLLYPARGRVGPAARRNGCISNMKQISLALLTYESVHGHFPPPYTTDDEGNPLHSWRVLILPYLEEQELYDSMDLTKPWYHPDNLALANRMPPVYACPADRSFSPQADQTTAYVAIVGDRTVWRRHKRTSLADISDGPEQTLLLLESEAYRLHWMSTADPSFEMLGPRNSKGETLLTGGPHKGQSVGVFCDAHTSCFSEFESFTTIQAMATIDGGEEMAERALAK